VHVDQLRFRAVDALTAQEAAADRLSDDLLLEQASEMGRPLVTYDIRLHALAGNWQREGRDFCGLIFGHPMQVSIGQFVRDLEIVAKATDPQDWISTILRLPL
jgi:hypothetical protein